VLVLTISANDELEALDALDELDEPEPPRLPALVPVPPAEAEFDEELLDVFDDVDPAETESPGWRLESDTIVPPTGACSCVCSKAVFALWTLASALYTDA
jgi:hypothetical protein